MTKLRLGLRWKVRDSHWLLSLGHVADLAQSFSPKNNSDLPAIKCGLQSEVVEFKRTQVSVQEVGC